MTGFRYDPSSLYSPHSDIVIGTMVQKCQYCKALEWSGEPPGLSCSNCKVILDNLACTPDLLSDLLLGQSSQSRHFLHHIRKYNTAFQMTSFGCKKREIEGKYMPTLKVQGKVYHLIGSLLPKADEQAQFLPVYFMGDSVEEARRGGTIASYIRMEIIRPIQTMLHNAHIFIFKTTLQRLQLKASLTTTKSPSVQKPHQESIGGSTMPQKLAR
jgi:hypothetical protein